MNRRSRQTPAGGSARRSPPQRIRIIAGRWRGRLLDVPDRDGLRPTGDRIRETLFSWLQPRLPGACCLDLFAGTGALGIEAASRGAAAVHLFEHDGPAAINLRTQLQKLEAPAAVELHQRDVLTVLAAGPQTGIPAADIVFVDPPFAANLQQRVLQLLADGHWLRPGAMVYLESPAGSLHDLLPALDDPGCQEQATTARPSQRWHLLREKRAGQVSFGLVTLES